LSAAFRLETEGSVGIVRLSRPPVNAVTFALLGELAEVIANPHHRFPKATALVLVADGPHFSAGMDRTELQAVNRQRLNDAAEALAAILDGPLPLVAAVHGSAVGTGFILAACADILVIESNAEVWLPEVDLGMLGGAGHAARWLPGPLVRRMVLTGERVRGEVFHRQGAVDPSGESTVGETAMNIAQRLANKDVSVIRVARQVLAQVEIEAASIHRTEMKTTPVPTTAPENPR